MGEQSKAREEMEKTVIRALERRPEVAVPEGFAVRVARSVRVNGPAKSPARAEMRPVFGRTAGYLGVAAMAVVLLLLTWAHPEALEAGRGFLFGVEMLLVAQLLAVGLWLGLKSDGLG